MGWYGALLLSLNVEVISNGGVEAGDAAAHSQHERASKQRHVGWQRIRNFPTSACSAPSRNGLQMDVVRTSSTQANIREFLQVSNRPTRWANMMWRACLFTIDADAPRNIYEGNCFSYLQENLTCTEAMFASIADTDTKIGSSWAVFGQNAARSNTISKSWVEVRQEYHPERADRLHLFVRNA